MTVLPVITLALIVLTVVLLVASAFLVVARISRGPTALDGVVAADVLVAIVLASLATEQVVTHDRTGLPILLVVSLLGFTGSVAMARLIVRAQGQRERYRALEESPGEPRP